MASGCRPAGHIPHIQLLKPVPASMAPIIHPPTVNLNGLGGGLMPSSGTMRMRWITRPHLRLELEVG